MGHVNAKGIIHVGVRLTERLGRDAEWGGLRELMVSIPLVLHFTYQSAVLMW